jgi:hypothetical protein
MRDPIAADTCLADRRGKRRKEHPPMREATAAAISRSTARPTPVQRAAVSWVGRAPYVLSIALLAVSIVAAVGALLFPGAIPAPAVTVGNMQGTALVLGVVTLPVLAVSMVLLARGVAVALILWLGALGSIAYQSVLFLFGVAFNSFFFLDVAMLSLAVWSIVALAGRMPIDEVADRVGTGAPVRLVSGYLLVNAALFGVLWLRATVPPILSGEPPAFLEGTGMTTGPVQILDLAFTLPLMTLGAVLLWRRRPWGRVLSGALLVMLAIETASIGVDQWWGHALDPASPAASAALTPVFSVLTAIGISVLALFLRRPPTEGSR